MHINGSGIFAGRKLNSWRVTHWRCGNTFTLYNKVIRKKCYLYCKYCISLITWLRRLMCISTCMSYLMYWRHIQKKKQNKKKTPKNKKQAIPLFNLYFRINVCHDGLSCLIQGQYSDYKSIRPEGATIKWLCMQNIVWNHECSLLPETFKITPWCDDATL